jgi:hypothetical protein
MGGSIQRKFPARVSTKTPENSCVGIRRVPENLAQNIRPNQQTRIAFRETDNRRSALAAGMGPPFADGFGRLR